MTKARARRIVHGIWVEGLGHSTWRDNYEEAYQDLAVYLEDIAMDFLKRHRASEKRRRKRRRQNRRKKYEGV